MSQTVVIYTNSIIKNYLIVKLSTYSFQFLENIPVSQTENDEDPVDKMLRKSPWKKRKFL